ncbi:alanine racemase [Psychromonas sp. RZ22]|nr:alanine racemase [Psychromonas sp. RZ22]
MDIVQKDTTYAEINLSALQHNIKILKQHAPQSKVVAIIKANAYGHGMLKLAEQLQISQQVHALGVARLGEALQLREAGIRLPIILLEGFFNNSDLPLLAEHQLQTVIHSQDQLQGLLNSDLTEKLTIWLKLDTGMHRLGFHPSEFNRTLEILKNTKKIQQPVNFITHFNSADELDNPITTPQIQLFKTQTANQPGLCSLANSAGVLAWPEAHADMIRPGIAMYGVSPFPDKSSNELQLKPVMTLKSHLIAVRQHSVGESVGYGASWTAQENTILGVIAVGYGDGYPRMAPAGTPILVNGRIVPIVGRVSMDMITVDLGINSNDRVGDDVVLWGEGLPVELVAKHIGTVAYELVTKLTVRVPLSYCE